MGSPHAHKKKKKLAQKGLTVSFKYFTHVKPYHTLVLRVYDTILARQLWKGITYSGLVIISRHAVPTRRVEFWEVARDFKHSGGEMKFNEDA